MRAEVPEITDAFIAASYYAHEVREQTLLSPTIVARLTNTSLAYWDDLRVQGKGPPVVEVSGMAWYPLAGLQAWLRIVPRVVRISTHE